MKTQRIRRINTRTKIVAYGTLGGTWALLTGCAIVAITHGADVFWTLVPWCVASAIYIEGFRRSKL